MNISLSNKFIGVVRDENSVTPINPYFFRYSSTKPWKIQAQSNFVDQIQLQHEKKKNFKLGNSFQDSNSQ